MHVVGSLTQKKTTIVTSNLSIVVGFFVDFFHFLLLFVTFLIVVTFATLFLLLKVGKISFLFRFYDLLQVLIQFAYQDACRYNRMNKVFCDQACQQVILKHEKLPYYCL
jgi:hypothetical protein